MFFVGLLLIYIFAVKLNWLPLGSNYSYGATPSLSLSFIWDVLKHALLPGLSLVIVTAGLWVYSMRNNMITTISEDYVKTARAKGLPTRRIMFDYAGRNAILPNLTGFAMQLGYVLGGAIVIEYLFSYPGLGYLFYTATTDHDLPLMQGLFLFYTLAVLICVLIADLRHRGARSSDAGRLRWRFRTSRSTTAITDVEATRAPRRFLRAVLGNRKAAAGAVILLVMAFVAAFPGLIAPDDPQAAIYAQNRDRRPPTCLGTTQLGQDVFSQLDLEHAPDADRHADGERDRDLPVDDHRRDLRVRRAGSPIAC